MLGITVVTCDVIGIGRYKLQPVDAYRSSNVLVLLLF